MPNLLKKLLVAMGATLALLAATTAPANAGTATSSNTLTSQAQVNAVTKSMLSEHKTAATACKLHQAVGGALKYAKAGKTIPLKVATAAVKAANKTGSGFCGAASAIVGTVAEMQVTYSKYKRVYVKQTIESPKRWEVWKKTTVTRWVGATSTRTTKYTYKV